MSDNNETNSQGCTAVGAFERNRYFYGKLLSVDDFQTEQDYFREKIRLLFKNLAGNGIIEGLEVSNLETANGELRLLLGAGYALDCCGNLIVVEAAQNLTLDNFPDDATLYLYLHYDECDKDRVAAMNETSSCEESCCSNRIAEIFRLTLDNQPPEGAAEGGCIDPAQMCSHEGVLLAVLQKSGSVYEIDAAATQKGRFTLPSNARLSHLLCEHVNDTDNPHHVTAAQVGAIKSINHIQNAGGNIDLTSTDGSIEISPDDAANTLNLQLSKTVFQEIVADIAQIKADLEKVLRYLMDKALKMKLQAYTKVYEHFASEIAALIVKSVREAVDKRVYLSREQFFSLMEYLTNLEHKLVEEIGESADPKRLEYYKKALEGLAEAMHNGDLFAIAVAQDEVCEMAEWLVPLSETVTVPDIVTLSIEKAAAKLAEAGLFIGTTTHQVSDAPENSVLSQNPEAGSEAEKGSRVDVALAVKPDQISVPDVMTLYIEEASQVLKKANLTTGEVGESVSDAEPGTVLEQTPAAGTQVDPGSAVALVVAKAREMTVVPGIIKLLQDEAVEVLAKAKLSFGEITEKISELPAGTILAQDPKEGTRVAINSQVAATVAVAAASVKVPSLVEKSLESAQTLLAKAKLQAGDITYVASRAAKGTVVGQSPESGTSVPVGSAVNLSVSKGLVITLPDDGIGRVSVSDNIAGLVTVATGIKVPDVTGKNSSEAARIIKAAGLTMGTLTREISAKTEGIVLRQSPEAGTSVAEGAAVSLVVAKKAAVMRDISGIGAVSEARLGEAGITSVDMLAETESSRVAELLGTTDSNALRIISDARIITEK